MNTKLYYTAPSNEMFNELRARAMDIWKTYDNAYGYVDEKSEKLKDLANVQDNFMYMVAMFDMDNQRKLADSLSPETRQAVRERMVDGGNPPEYIMF